MDDLRRIVEAILFVAHQPVPATELAQVTEIPRERIEALLAEIRADFEARDTGMVLREVAGGWRLFTHPAAAPYVERFVLSIQQPRLSKAALETLAIIAYKQPVSRQQVASIRGVESEGVIATLVARGLVEESGRDPGPGQAILYATTTRFLERMGLGSLGNLPPIADLLPPPAAADELEP